MSRYGTFFKLTENSVYRKIFLIVFEPLHKKGAGNEYRKFEMAKKYNGFRRAASYL